MAQATTNLPSSSTVTLRRPGTAISALLLTAGALALCWYIVVNPGVDHSLVGRAIGASVLLVLTWFIWRVGGYPCLKLTRTHLVIRNPVLCHVVPWRAVDTIEARDDLTVVLWDGREIRVWAFSHSLLAEIFGDRNPHRAIELSQQRKASAPAGAETITHQPRLTIHLRWWVLPVVVVLAGAATIIAWLLDPGATLT
ncbi:hypothetical protein [Tenggerimyces flavus]|uniref:PH domain-containing protein n=1 Tax=Tenggerimyces flavus TaxID=1708749 RepID=A0ABV7YA29_9ACTN|nr:hypothetical protein [Tenggerimyces flavus]MBM7786691.1 hypothetical protein [Tenggerimyces flavus]